MRRELRGTTIDWGMRALHIREIGNRGIWGTKNTKEGGLRDTTNKRGDWGLTKKMGAQKNEGTTRVRGMWGTVRDREIGDTKERGLRDTTKVKGDEGLTNKMRALQEKG